MAEQDKENQTTKSSKPTWLTIGLGVLLTMVRWLPHQRNLQPIGALGYFGGARLRSWHAYVLPIAVLFVTDVGLWALWQFNPMYQPWHPLRLIIYPSFLFYVWIGRMMMNTRSPVRIGVGLVIANLQFFVVTNFAVWLAAPWFGQAFYAQNWSGLMACYLAAVPFYQANSIGFAGWSLVGDVFFGALLFAAYAMFCKMFASETAPEAEPMATR